MCITLWFNAYSIIELFSFSSTFVERCSGLKGNLILIIFPQQYYMIFNGIRQHNDVCCYDWRREWATWSPAHIIDLDKPEAGGLSAMVLLSFLFSLKFPNISSVCFRIKQKYCLQKSPSVEMFVTPEEGGKTFKASHEDRFVYARLQLMIKRLSSHGHNKQH